MARLFIPLVFGLILFVVWLFAVLDVISTDEMLMRNLPKLVWLFIVVLFPTVGAIAWFALGRPIGAGLTPGPSRARPSRSWQQQRGERPRRSRPRGPEDRDDWAAGTNPSGEPGRSDTAGGEAADPDLHGDG